ncbi:DUF4811 domain-containing protein [Pediococcus ethanolidurans]|uniref:DUF4811 domain-containing protein n=1 Tax=Pediococcus ethanolidurans TaxID=319653 RepID=UPI001C1EADD3|nr:DUF4811 domain-containing protein [Pediococcus ethanolidurans]MBU7555236.1 DUF4811 domain-containing protein [Pediococcus ethanolidurans]MCV3324460.1 DUF4811 domain-containing protein [Pediococcus ethanolidurans]
MIIFVAVILAIALFISMVSISKPLLRNLTSLIIAILFALSLSLIVLNGRDHFGMKKITTTQTADLISVSPSKQLKMLLYQNVGTSGKNRVYIYKTQATQKKPTTTNPDPTHTTNKVKVTTQSPRIVTKTTRWVYKNDAYKLWFGIAGNNHKLIQHKNTFEINNDWLTLSSVQAKKLQSLAKQNTAKMKKEAQVYVTAAVKKTLTAAMRKDPTMSKALTAEATKKATAAYQKQAMAKMVAESK